MFEKIHYVIATLCGVAMVGVMLASEKGEGYYGAVIAAGLYLVSKALLLGKKK